MITTKITHCVKISGRNENTEHFLTYGKHGNIFLRTETFSSQYKLNKTLYKPSGKKILNTTFYPDQKGINKFIKGKSELKGNKQVKTKNFESEKISKIWL